MAIITGNPTHNHLFGTTAADTIAGRNGDDVIYARGGDDVITGGRGSDVITTGAGFDVVNYTDAKESAGGNLDTVTDFKPRIDKIDLSAFLGDQDLEWGYTTPTANGVWIERVGADTFVHADVDGNPDSIDFTLKLADFGGRVLTNTDFIGVENSAPVANDDAVMVKEDKITLIRGRLLANDTDPDAGSVLQVLNPGRYVGDYGTLTIKENGRYTYRLNNDMDAVQELNRRETLTDSFSYTATDNGLTSDAVLHVTIVGVNEPVLIG
jgi:VCBS repeat-containing protein